MDNDLDPYDDAVARALDGRRAEKRMSYAELAERSGLNVRTVHRYLKGERSIPMSKFFAMTFAMGVQSSEVIEAAFKIVESAEHERRG